ncbi:mas-related G-protein coupled receptor member H-like [Prinia subflava]|uniref:mas-related G-protein coupled receptor member H-like n=1 Tax=Prinia subflava TaxID=208062 RepID=UPI002FE0D9E6
MEVTTVSPSPASATEGDDICETDVTSVAIHSVTLLISLCGLVGNGAVLYLLSLKIRTAGTFDLAFADFLLLLFTIPSALLFLVEDVSCSPIVPLLYQSFLFQLSVVSYYWALIQLMFTSNIVYTDKFCKFCCHCKLPKRLLWLVFSVQYWAFFALFTFILAVTNLCPSHQQEHCRAALISMYVIILLIFAAPMVISSTIDFIEAKWCSKKLKTKRQNIVVFLMVVFIVVLSLFNFLQQLGYTVVSSQIFFLLNCIHSSIKPFIYFLAGGFRSPCSLKSLRLSLQRVFDEQEENTSSCNEVLLGTQGSEPGDPFPCSAEGPCQSGSGFP